MKYGINGGYLDLLAEAEIERIHRASLALLVRSWRLLRI